MDPKTFAFGEDIDTLDGQGILQELLTSGGCIIRVEAPSVVAAFREARLCSFEFFDKTPPAVKALAFEECPVNNAAAASTLPGAVVGGSEQQQRSLNLGYEFYSHAKNAVKEEHDSGDASDTLGEEASASNQGKDIGVESFTVQLPRSGSFAPFPYPIQPVEFEPVISNWFNQVKRIASRVLVAVLSSHMGASCADRAEQIATCFSHDSASYEESVLFLRRYRGWKPTAGAHTDSGVLSLMPYDAECGGFEVFSHGSGGWQPIHPKLDKNGGPSNAVDLLLFGGEAFVDLLVATRSRDKTQSGGSDTSIPFHHAAAVHRVVVPDSEPNSERLTMPFQLRLHESWREVLPHPEASPAVRPSELRAKALCFSVA